MHWQLLPCTLWEGGCGRQWAAKGFCGRVCVHASLSPAWHLGEGPQTRHGASGSRDLSVCKVGCALPLGTGSCHAHSNCPKVALAPLPWNSGLASGSLSVTQYLLATLQPAHPGALALSSRQGVLAEWLNIFRGAGA